MYVSLHGISGLLESTVRLDRVCFNLYEVSDDGGDKWTQYSSDAIAVIFVADAR